MFTILGLDYVFAHYCGILVTSTAYFFVYCAFKKNKPTINAAATLPAFVAGIMWGIAQAAFFVANEALQEAVSFPIITRVRIHFLERWKLRANKGFLFSFLV